MEIALSFLNRHRGEFCWFSYELSPLVKRMGFLTDILFLVLTSYRDTSWLWIAVVQEFAGEVNKRVFQWLLVYYA